MQRNHRCCGYRSGSSPVDETIDPTMEKERLAYGVVTDCSKLNVRKSPKGDAEIIAMIEVPTDVMVDIAGSTDEFYKICTAAGIEGFCMRKFITIRK